MTHSAEQRASATGFPAPRDEDLDFFGLSHAGLVRPTNQDHFLYCTLHKTMRVGGTNLPDAGFLERPSQRLASFGMVADGVGSGSGGEEASRAAVEGLATYVLHTMRSFYTFDVGHETAFQESLRDAARLGHEALRARAAASGDSRGMATTLTVMIAIWPHLYTLHVGDSRCYRFREGRLEQLTRDQTMAQDLVDLGALPADRLATSPFSHMLSSSLGGATTLPIVTRSDLRPGDVVVLCTDGLTKHVPDDSIASRLANLSSSEQVARQLIDEALQDGGTDNLTVVVLRAIVRPAGAP